MIRFIIITPVRLTNITSIFFVGKFVWHSFCINPANQCNVKCWTQTLSNPRLYLRFAASQYLSTVICFKHPILHYTTDYSNVFITYRRRLSKARPSTSSMGMVVSCEAMGPCNIARNTELASARTALLPGKRHCSGPTRKMTSLPASLSNREFHLSRQNTQVILQKWLYSMRGQITGGSHHHHHE
jgi:hypothetical protein